MDTFSVFVFLLCAISGLVAFISALCICLDERVYKFDNVLKNKYDFVRCVFQYQFAVAWILSDYNINLLGIIILNILVTFFMFPYNFMIFCLLLLLLCLKALALGFYKIFRKKIKR